MTMGKIIWNILFFFDWYLRNGGKNQHDTIKLLIEHRADVNIPDSEEVTPLEHAREKEFVEI